MRILRLPLFLTAVADSVAGYLVALSPDLSRFRWDVVGLLAGTSAGLYLFGMVQNDLADIRRDRAMNVPRPLVTGDLNVGSAVALLVLAVLLAAGCAVRLTGGALFAATGAFVAINLYNLGAKFGPAYVAMSVMGLCRVLNYLMGMSAIHGFPRRLTFDMLLPSGPLWIRHALALFFITAVITGYSICARRGTRVSSRPWGVALVGAAVAGFGLIVLSVVLAPAPFVAPVARVFAALALPALWPGGLWAATGPERKPVEYVAFIPRVIYWIVLMDAAFVVDSLLIPR